MMMKYHIITAVMQRKMQSKLMNLIDDEKRKAELLTSFGNKDVAAMCTKSRILGIGRYALANTMYL